MTWPPAGVGIRGSWVTNQPPEWPGCGMPKVKLSTSPRGVASSFEKGSSSKQGAGSRQ